jgi:CHAD domain-containing protein
MLEHLAELRTSPKCAAAATWLADAVGLQRQGLREASERDVPSAEVLDRLAAWLPVRDEIARARDATEPLIAESVHRQLDAFAEQASRLASPDPNSAAEGQNPHELRISGKALRYTLEMAVVQGHALPKRVMKAFKRMQELLGAWHDYVVLTDQALKSSLDVQLGHHDASRQEQVLDLARFTNRRAGQHLDAFRKLWSSTGEDVAAAIRAAIEPPIASESGTDPGPNGSAAPAGPAASPPASPSAAS